jgi:hypothetical protein
LDEKKHGDTALKALALEWLGDISARIRSRKNTIIQSIKSVTSAAEFLFTKLPGKNITDSTGAEDIQHCWEVQKHVVECLNSGNVEDSVYEV